MVAVAEAVFFWAVGGGSFSFFSSVSVLGPCAIIEFLFKFQIWWSVVVLPSFESAERNSHNENFARNSVGILLCFPAAVQKQVIHDLRSTSSHLISSQKRILFHVGESLLRGTSENDSIALFSKRFVRASSFFFLLLVSSCSVR
jgi:hypothetical protein